MAPMLRKALSRSARGPRARPRRRRAKSRSGSVSMRSAMPSASENSTSATASGSARRRSTPSACLARQQRGDVVARAAQQLGELGGDLLVAPREREQLEDERDELGVVAHELLERGDAARR